VDKSFITLAPEQEDPAAMQCRPHSRFSVTPVIDYTNFFTTVNYENNATLTISIITFGIMAFSIMTFSIMTFSTMAIIIMTFGIMITTIIPFKHNDN
jgi:hypothetical protein